MQTRLSWQSLPDSAKAVFEMEPAMSFESFTHKVEYGELLAMVLRALTENGYDERIASPIARTIVDCERDGVSSHGLLRLPGFVESVRSGWADGRVLPSIVSESPSMRVVDARNGFTHLALEESRKDLSAMARKTGTAILLIRNAHHFAALWPDIEGFADDGLLAFSCVNSRARVTAWGSDKPVFGTNASAFACPRAGGSPVVWDQAASVMSQGDILLASRDGRKLPAGVGVDRFGVPTDDPNAILEGGALQTFGGVKGASIAFMIEVLAAVLSGSVDGFDSQAQGTLPSKCGQFVLLIDSARAGVDVAARVESLMKAAGVAGVNRTPGSRRYDRRAKSLADGIVITESARQLLEDLSAGQTKHRFS